MKPHLNEDGSALVLPDGGKLAVPAGWTCLWWETTRDSIGISLIKADVAKEMATKMLEAVKHSEARQKQMAEKWAKEKLQQSPWREMLAADNPPPGWGGNPTRKDVLG